MNTFLSFLLMGAFQMPANASPTFEYGGDYHLTNLAHTELAADTEEDRQNPFNADSPGRGGQPAGVLVPLIVGSAFIGTVILLPKIDAINKLQLKSVTSRSGSDGEYFEIELRHNSVKNPLTLRVLLKRALHNSASDEVSKHLSLIAEKVDKKVVSATESMQTLQEKLMDEISQSSTLEWVKVISSEKAGESDSTWKKSLAFWRFLLMKSKVDLDSGDENMASSEAAKASAKTVQESVVSDSGSSAGVIPRGNPFGKTAPSRPNPVKSSPEHKASSKPGTSVAGDKKRSESPLTTNPFVETEEQKQERKKRKEASKKRAKEAEAKRKKEAKERKAQLEEDLKQIQKEEDERLEKQAKEELKEQQKQAIMYHELRWLDKTISERHPFITGKQDGQRLSFWDYKFPVEYRKTEFYAVSSVEIANYTNKSETFHRMPNDLIFYKDYTYDVGLNIEKDTDVMFFNTHEDMTIYLDLLKELKVIKSYSDLYIYELNDWNVNWRGVPIELRPTSFTNLARRYSTNEDRWRSEHFKEWGVYQSEATMKKLDFLDWPVLTIPGENNKFSKSSFKSFDQIFDSLPHDLDFNELKSMITSSEYFISHRRIIVQD